MSKNIEANQKLIDLIVKYESVARIDPDGRVYAYHDAVGYPTIGIGHLLSKVVNEPLSKYSSITVAEAYSLLKADLVIFITGVNSLVSKELTENQFSAIVSLSFNIGLGNLKTSTLLRKLNANAPLSEVANEFLKWNMSKGVVLKGLVNRRASERELFLK